MAVKQALEKKPARARVTQQQIAELAGVSHVAVSYALTRPHDVGVNPEKQREIREIARQLGYQPRKFTSRAIGLVVDLRNLGLNVVTNTIQYAHAELARHGYSLHLLAADEEHPEQFTSLEKTVDGVLIFDLAPTIGLLPDGMPGVLISDTNPDELAPSIDWVALDIVSAARNSTRHLLEYGHRRLALLVGDEKSAFYGHQRHGFFEAVAAAGLPAEAGRVLEVPHQGYIAAVIEKTMSEAEPPTAILTGAAGHAGVALTVLQNAGLRVPQDVSLLALEDGRGLTAMRPTITAHTQVEASVVEEAVARLLLRIRKSAKAREPLRRVLPGTLIERSSTGPAPGAP